MNNPLVSIIIPTFNRAHLIDETLNSVLKQTYNNWECLVVDDGSMDATDELMASYCLRDSRIKYHLRPSNEIKGASTCRNIGLHKAQGQYVIFLDSDDLLIDFCLNNRIQKLKAHSNNYFLVFPMMVEETHKPRIHVQIPVHSNYLTEFLSYKIHWSIMSVLWDRTFLKQLKGFNPHYPRLNDPEIHIRALLEAKDNYKVFFNEVPDTVYRVNAEVKNNYEFALKYHASLVLLISEISKKLKETNQKDYIPYLKGYLKDYMDIIFKFNTRRNNFILFHCFYRNQVISFWEFWYLTILYYSFFIFNFCSEIMKRRIVDFFKN